MHRLYLLGFKGLHGLGAKRASVRIARQLDMRYCHRFGKAAQLRTAIQEFILGVQTFPLCEGADACGLPVLSPADPFHQRCRQIQAEIEVMWAARDTELAAQTAASMEAHYAELDRQEAIADFLAGLCTQLDCFRHNNTYSSKCDEHDTSCWNCMSDPCACPAAEDEPDESDEPEDDLDDLHDDRQEAEECPGVCGQPEYACTCEELDSWKRHAMSVGYWTT